MSDAYAYSIAEPEICTMKHEPQPSSDREEFSLEAVSALFDGEGDLAALDQLLAAEANSAAHAHWHSCALIGDALRATGKGRWQSSTAFLAGVRSQLDAITPANVQPNQRWCMPLLRKRRPTIPSSAGRWSLGWPRWRRWPSWAGPLCWEAAPVALRQPLNWRRRLVRRRRRRKQCWWPRRKALWCAIPGWSNCWPNTVSMAA